MDYAVINMAGHVVGEPVTRKGKDGREFSTFSLAVNQFYGGQDITSYYDCVVSGTLCQSMQKAHVRKGSALSLTGKQTIRTYTNREGNMGTSVNINVLDWRFEGSRARRGEENSGQRESEKEEVQREDSGSICGSVEVTGVDDLPV